MSVHLIRVLYVVGGLLEVVGIACVVTTLLRARRRAKRFRETRAYFGPVMSGPGLEKIAPNRMRQQERRQRQRVEYEQERQEKELLTLLAGSWLDWLGPVLLVAGVVVGTVANLANT